MSWVEQEVVRLADRIQHDRDEQRLADHLHRQQDLQAEVRAYLAAHPGATANAVWRELGGRRGDVLLAVRRVREAVPVAAVPAGKSEAA